MANENQYGQGNKTFEAAMMVSKSQNFEIGGKKHSVPTNNSRRRQAG